jgi:hypothetical protein
LGLENKPYICKYRYVFEAENRHIVFAGSVADPDPFDTDPDTAFQSDTDPDPNVRY